MKKVILFTFIAIAVQLSGIAGLFLSVRASDDMYAYSFYCANSYGYTATKNKLTGMRVYIHPIEGPTMKYTVQGKNGSTWYNRSGSYVIYNGTKASITNTVYANNDSKVRVKFQPVSTAYATASGYWHPDPSHTYTIFN